MCIYIYMYVHMLHIYIYLHICRIHFDGPQVRGVGAARGRCEAQQFGRTFPGDGHGATVTGGTGRSTAANGSIPSGKLT